MDHKQISLEWFSHFILKLKPREDRQIMELTKLDLQQFRSSQVPSLKGADGRLDLIPKLGEELCIYKCTPCYP